MKKLLIVLFLLAPLLSFGQIEKGNWLVGGAASFSSIKYDDAAESNTTYSIAPNIGYFLTKNLALGVDFTFSSPTKNYIFIGAHPFARYYLKNNYFQAKYLTNTATSYSERGFDLSVGRAFFLKQKVALEPELYYKRLKGWFNHSDFGMRLGLQFYW